MGDQKKEMEWRWMKWDVMICHEVGSARNGMEWSRIERNWVEWHGMGSNEVDAMEWDEAG